MLLLLINKNVNNVKANIIKISKLANIYFEIHNPLIGAYILNN